MKKLRIYADTSVFGGWFDDEFRTHSVQFFANLYQGKFVLLISESVIKELSLAPVDVQNVLKKVSPKYVEQVSIDANVIALRNEYMKAGIVGKKWLEDATHVASATCSRADAIVSWNFKHIVRLDKMRSYNRVNMLEGYGMLTIITPKEVTYEKG